MTSRSARALGVMAAAALAAAGAAGCSATGTAIASAHKTSQQRSAVSAASGAASPAAGTAAGTREALTGTAAGTGKTLTGTAAGGKALTGTAAGVGKTVTGTGTAVRRTAGTTVGAGTTGETYAQFSMMDGHNAGQYSAGDGVEYQWAWNQIHGVYEIRWDRTDAWNRPPTDVEHFFRRGGWVELDGFENDQVGAYGNQRVTREEIGNGNCQNMRVLPTPDGLEHYAEWTVPSAAYCLKTWGTVSGDGKSENFLHIQIWYPPQACQSRHFGTVRCIRQHEVWGDSGGKPGQVHVNLERDVYFGQGMGPALIINQTMPISWHADMDRFFAYS